MTKSVKEIVLSVLGIIILMVGMAACGAQPNTPDDVIRIGGLFDLSGATSDVGIPFAAGVRDYVQFLNEQGGINERQIELIDEDYGFNIERAALLYNDIVKEKLAVAIIGWGPGGDEFLPVRVADDQIPFMSASYSEQMAISQSAPASFFVGVTYSDQIRIVLRYILDQWTDTSRPPRVAFLYDDTPHGLSSIQNGRDYAASHNIEIVSEQIVSYSSIDATDQLAAMAAVIPDYAIVQATTTVGSVILRNAQTLEHPTQIILLNWAADEKLIALSGEAAEGVMGTAPFVFVSGDASGLDEIKNYNLIWGINPNTLNVHYVQGWVTMQVLAEGLRLAGDDLSPENIHRALQSIQDFDTGDVTAPISFGEADHYGARALRIAQVQNGKWVPITEFIGVQP